MNDYKILTVDDEPDILEILDIALCQDYHMFKAQSGQEALDILSNEEIDLIIADQRMPGMTGIEFLEKSFEYNPRIIKILLTGYTHTEELINAINKCEVYKYIRKPFKPDELKMIVKRALEHYETERENKKLYQELQKTHKNLARDYVELQKEITKKEIFTQIIGVSSAIQKIFDDIDRISSSDITVLINGETGTGKELIARAIHRSSPRKNKKFVVQDCGSIPDSLLESELFGHKKGSFTGAVSDKRGLLEIADGGTIFLDEIGETSPSLQVRLLRFLQEGEIRPVGSETIKKMDVRVISATHRDLLNEIEKGSFRSDLYYRISTYPISVPPLRFRREDIPLLAAHFLSKYNRKNLNSHKRLSREAINLLLLYDFPGNVRELENEVERAATMATDSDLILPAHLSDRMKDPRDTPSDLEDSLLQKRGKLSEMVKELEKRAIEIALNRHRGNKTKVAAELGISRLGLRKKMTRYGIQDEKFPVKKSKLHIVESNES
jgi:two-component system response regulator HupR/HoxA